MNSIGSINCEPKRKHTHTHSYLTYLPKSNMRLLLLSSKADLYWHTPCCGLMPISAQVCAFKIHKTPNRHSHTEFAYRRTKMPMRPCPAPCLCQQNRAHREFIDTIHKNILLKGLMDVVAYSSIVSQQSFVSSQDEKLWNTKIDNTASIGIASYIVTIVKGWLTLQTWEMVIS